MLFQIVMGGFCLFLFSASAAISPWKYSGDDKPPALPWMRIEYF